MNNCTYCGDWKLNHYNYYFLFEGIRYYSIICENCLEEMFENGEISTNEFDEILDNKIEK